MWHSKAKFFEGEKGPPRQMIEPKGGGKGEKNAGIYGDNRHFAIGNGLE